MSGELRLFALDADDLAVVSAHVQDAVVQLHDLTWSRRERRFIMAMNRFVWENAPTGLFRRKEYERRRSVLHFDRVTAVRYTGLETTRPDRVLSLLALTFAEIDPPSGQVEILFAGGPTLRLSVECIEAQLADLGPAWSTAHAPHHSLNAS